MAHTPRWLRAALSTLCLVALLAILRPAGSALAHDGTFNLTPTGSTSVASGRVVVSHGTTHQIQVTVSGIGDPSAYGSGKQYFVVWAVDTSVSTRTNAGPLQGGSLVAEVPANNSNFNRIEITAEESLGAASATGSAILQATISLSQQGSPSPSASTSPTATATTTGAASQQATATRTPTRTPTRSGTVGTATRTATSTSGGAPAQSGGPPTGFLLTGGVLGLCLAVLGVVWLRRRPT